MAMLVSVSGKRNQMKRSEMVGKVKNLVYMANPEDLILTDDEASQLLQGLEDAGMKPPALPEDYCQAIMQVYYAGYTFNKWEEDVVKDEEVMKKYNARMEWKANRGKK